MSGENRDDLNRNVPPYRHNSAAWIPRLPICLLVFLAAAISTHLSMFRWGLIDSVWDPFFGDGSARVLKSGTAEKMYGILGIHDAALGTLAYLGDAIRGSGGSPHRWQYRPWLVILFGIDMISLGIVSVLLVSAQAFLVGEWCFLCLVTTVIYLILVYWAWDKNWAWYEVRVSLAFLRLVWKHTSSKRLLWRAFWGYREDAFDENAESLLSREVR